MRKTFYELLESQNVNVVAEYKRLLSLFAEENCVVLKGYYNTVAAYIDATYFRDLPFRGAFINLGELIQGIQLPECSDQLDDLYLLCEFLIALLPEEKTQNDKNLSKQADTIRNNIFYVLEKTSHELKEGKNGNLIVVAKNQSAILAAELVEDNNVSLDIIEYNHYSLKGDLNAKRNILVSIGRYIEPTLKDRTFQETEYKRLISDTSFLFNNFHIRHNNIEGPKAQDYIKSLSNSELEKWYDSAYDMSLAVVITKECKTVQNEITKLKKDYKWNT